MLSPCIREASEACFHGCCLTPFLSLPESHSSSHKPTTGFTISQYNFAESTASSLYPNTHFTNHESLPSLEQSFSKFTRAYPLYSRTDQADQIRAQEYHHLQLSSHVCLDYIGQCLFSYAKKQSHQVVLMASSSSPPPLLLNSPESPFFHVSHKSAGKLNSQVLFGGQESEMEYKTRKRIMNFMNVSEADYTMVFTANQSCAFKILAESYPFQSNRNLVTAYDYESEAEELMIESSKKKGARVMSAEFSWPNLRIVSTKLEKILLKKKKKKGLFVFPLQSRMTGARYSYLWMSMAQENGWHVLLDACALGPKDMETLGLSLFKPDFLICSFYKVFGEDPSGFGCLFLKKTSVSVLQNFTAAASIGTVSLVPPSIPCPFLEESDNVNDEIETANVHAIEETQQSLSEIVELETPFESARSKNTEHVNDISGIEFSGLDHADSLGLMLIRSRARYLINWLINALMSLQHRNGENGNPLVRIYGPKIKIDRGPAVAFNVFDWKGEKIDPILVQKLADRNNISLSCGFLWRIWFSDKNEEQRKMRVEKKVNETDCSGSKISVVSAALGFLTNFEDVYRIWAFVSRFLDADFVEKERWRYMALNQKTIEV